MILDVQDLTCGYGTKKVLEQVSFSVDRGQVLCMLGPNGVGKTTLFETVMGLLKPISGQIFLDGRSRETMSIAEIAKLVAYVPQHHVPPFPYSVREVVATGRTAHIGRFSSPGGEDEEIVDQALSDLHILPLANKVYTQISGGERQMVLLARALAQQPQIMILDEPTSNLDFGNQIKVLEEINRLCKQGLCIVMTTHVPDHALICSATVLLLQRNRQFLLGSGDSVITQKNIHDTYGIDAEIIEFTNPHGNVVKTCVPLSGG